MFEIDLSPAAWALLTLGIPLLVGVGLAIYDARKGKRLEKGSTRMFSTLAMGLLIGAGAGVFGAVVVAALDKWIGD